MLGKCFRQSDAQPGFIGFEREAGDIQSPVNWRPLDASPEAIELDVKHALKIGSEYLTLIQKQSLSLHGIETLELGPGYNYGASLVLACHGANTAVADRFPVTWQHEYHGALYRALLREISELWPTINPSPLVRCIEDSTVSNVVKVFNSPAENLHGVADETIDVVLSNAVLEHLQNPELAALELHRVTRQGGVGLHQVDFRDHRDFSRPLEYLLLGADEFAKVFLERNAECGRQMRHFELNEFFTCAGFDVSGFEANWIASDEYLNDFIPRLRESKSAYRATPREDLRVISGHFTLRKPITQ